MLANFDDEEQIGGELGGKYVVAIRGSLVAFYSRNTRLGSHRTFASQQILKGKL
jgi:hypothetical protein